MNTSALRAVLTDRRLRSAQRFAGNARVRLAAAAAHRRGAPVPGMLSLVLPVYNVEQYLDECLYSLRAQNQRNIEIIVVDDGTPDRSVEIARRHRLRDPRIRIVHRPNGGLSAARNTGVAHARGEFIAFADSDDVVPPDGYAAAVSSLQRSGSDFAVLPYLRLRRGSVVRPPRWIGDAHRGERVGIRVEDFPDIMVNAIMCSKVFRRSFWSETGLSFIEGIIYEDQQVSAEAYARAAAFDVLPVPVYTWRSRDDRTSISQGKREVANLRAQLDAANASLDVLAVHATPALVTERVIQLLSNDMPQFTSLVVGCSDDFWRLLRDELPLLQGRLPDDDYLARIPAQQKVLNHLIVTGERRAAETFVERGGLGTRAARLGHEDVGHVMHLPLWRDPEIAVPDRLFLLSRSQTQPRTSVRSVTVTGATTLEVYAFAVMQNVDLSEGGQHVRAVARNGTEEVELAVETCYDDAVDEFLQVNGSGHCDYRRGAVRISIDTSALGAGTWVVRLDLTVGELSRSVVLGTAWPGGTGTVRHPLSAGPGRAAVASLGQGARGWFQLRVHDEGVVVHEAVVEGRELRLAGSGQPPERLVARRDGAASATARIESGPEGWTARIDLGPRATAGRPRETWRLSATCEQLPATVRYGPVAGDVDPPGAPLTWEPLLGRGGALVIRTWDTGVVVTEAVVDDDGVRLEVESAGLDLSEYDAVLLSVRASSTVGIETDGSTGRIRFPYRADRWGCPQQVLDSGGYLPRLVHRETGAQVFPRLRAEVLTSLPQDVLTSEVRARLVLKAGEKRRLGVEIAPPLALEERGIRNQLRLQELANGGAADERSAFFRTLYGEVTTDNALAVHDELRRRGTDLTLYWSVKDRSVPVPDGGVPLVEGTDEWHRRLGAAGVVMVNVHQPMWYRKPAGQVMVQTFHGYPYKGMGRSWWERSQLSASRVASYLDRAEDWDYLVSPASYATQPLLEAFFRPDAAEQVTVLESGYPRNDVLVRGDDEVRARVREVLGIRPDQTAVLYAPTFRDYLSNDGMTAASSDFFDPVEAARGLGDDYVLLLRGHAFNARANEAQVVGAGVRDVTYYPDINDLCLASDAAVLDYSSLRFDYALLRRPMVFLVPDRDTYHQMRPAILDFDATAPGPQVATTTEAVARLRDLPGLRREWAARVQEFIDSYADLDDGRASERVVDAVFGGRPSP